MPSFRNDYSEGAAPAILDALVATNAESTRGYTEGDPHCEHAREMIRELVGQPDAMVEFCVGGTSANLICINGLLTDYEGVIATPDAHIVAHETGAIGATGRTVLTTRDSDGFLSLAEARRVLDYQLSCGRHMTKPAALYITEATEFGGIWPKRQFLELCDFAHDNALAVYVDGARLANALTAHDNELSIQDIAAHADAFTIGGTKNGLLFGEAVVITNDRLKASFPYLQKERGGLLAKGRLLGVQFEAYLQDGRWIDYAHNANLRAMDLKRDLNALGLESFLPSTTNQQFFAVEPDLARVLMEEFGCEYFKSTEDGRWVIRFVCSWATTAEEVEEVVSFCVKLLKD